jgi:endo-1,4-beta-xylanase
MKKKKNTYIKYLLTVLLSVVSLFGQSPDTTKLSLRELSCKVGKHFGSLYDDCCTSSDLLYKQEHILRTECTMITNGNYFFNKCQPRINKYDFEKADKVNRFAQKNGMTVRGHTLIWHSHVPAWLKTMKATRSEKVKPAIKNHIETILWHAKGQVTYWDLVNEPLEENGTLRESFYKQVIGSHYIDSIFLWAHAADSSAKLYISEYGLEFGGPKADSLYSIAQHLLKNNIPLHGIAMHCHIRITSRYDFSTIRSVVKRFTGLGLKIHFSEVDIRIPIMGSHLFTDSQNDFYNKLTSLFLEEPGCDAMQVWGVSDAHSWIQHFYKGWGNACLFDSNYKPKSTYYAVVSAFMENLRKDNKNIQSEKNIE